MDRLRITIICGFFACALGGSAALATPDARNRTVPTLTWSGVLSDSGDDAQGDAPELLTIQVCNDNSGELASSMLANNRGGGLSIGDDVFVLDRREPQRIYRKSRRRGSPLGLRLGAGG